VVAVIGVTYFITRSRLGLAMASVREQEEIASDFGVPVQRIKTTAMVIAASFAGLMGSFYTWYTIFINPEMVFGTEIALMPLAMAMLGGSGVIIGPVIGAIFLFIVEETLWTRMAYLHTAAYGLVILFVGLFMPGGLVRLRPIRRALVKVGLYHEI
jgi:branched-chain amino acid transport system permease protein